MSDEIYMKAACANCPFRTDVKPFLHPERASQIAYSAANPYSEFHCHKTLDYVDTDDTGEPASTEKTKFCAGFFSMAINEGARKEPPGYAWPENVYAEPTDMIWAYDDAWENKA